MLFGFFEEYAAIKHASDILFPQNAVLGRDQLVGDGPLEPGGNPAEDIPHLSLTLEELGHIVPGETAFL